MYTCSDKDTNWGWWLIRDRREPAATDQTGLCMSGLYFLIYGINFTEVQPISIVYFASRGRLC